MRAVVFRDGADAYVVRDRVALTEVAHEGRALLDERRVGRTAADDRLSLPAHLREQAVHRRGVELAQSLQVAAHDLVSDRRAQEAHRGDHARVRGYQHPGDAQFLRDARGVNRRGTAESDERARTYVLT